MFCCPLGEVLKFELDLVARSDGVFDWRGMKVIDLVKGFEYTPIKGLGIFRVCKPNVGLPEYIHLRSEEDRWIVVNCCTSLRVSDSGVELISFHFNINAWDKGATFSVAIPRSHKGECTFTEENSSFDVFTTYSHPCGPGS